MNAEKPPASPENPELRYALSPEDVRRYISPQLTIGLGKIAVGNRLILKDIGNGFDDPDGYEAQYLDVMRCTKNARKQLEMLDDSKQRIMARLLQENGVSPWLRQQMHKGDILSSIVDKNDQTYTMSDETFLNFLEWHNFKLVEREAGIKTEAIQQYLRFNNRVEHAVAEQWLPTSTIRNLNKSLSVPVCLDDGMRTSVDGSLGIHARYAGEKYQYNFIAIAPHHEHNTQVYMHEYVHTIAGQAGQNGKELTTIAGTFGGKVGTLLEEAVTEQLANMLMHGEPDSTDPEHEYRKRSGAVYTNERYLLHALCTYGAKPVSIRKFYNAYVWDDTHPPTLSQPVERLLRSLERSFGSDVFDRLQQITSSDDIAECVKDLRRMNRPKSLASSIRSWFQ